MRTLRNGTGQRDAEPPPAIRTPALRDLLLAAAIACAGTVHAAPPVVEEIGEHDAQVFESFTAPTSIFHWTMCEPVQTTDNFRCTHPPLDFDKPFTRFPVALRFFDAADPKARGVESRRDNYDSARLPYFFILDAGHGRAVIDDAGTIDFLPAGIGVVVALKAGDYYRSTLVLGRQVRDGVANLSLKLVVPRGTTVYMPGTRDRMRGTVEWRRCEGENAPLVAAHTTGKIPNSHRYRSAEPCPARYTVNTTGADGRSPVTSYVFSKKAWWTGSGSNIQFLSQHWKIGPKDPPGLYTLEWWHAGKLLTRTRFEVKA